MVRFAVIVAFVFAGCLAGCSGVSKNPCNHGGDAKMDFPFDPGCETEFDDTEEDPATPPQCSNGMDDDGDGAMDYPQDPGCRSAGDPDEFNTVVGACGPSVEIAEIPPSGEF